MKKIICLLIVTAMSICMFSFFGCAPDDGSIPAMELSYLEDFECNLDGAKAIGLRKEKVTQTNPSSLQNNIDIFPTIYAEDDDDEDERYFMYYTTESYSSGKVEYDENSIKKVSFIKTSTSDDDDKTVKQEEIAGKINRMYAGNKFIFLQYVPLINMTGHQHIPYRDKDGEIHYRELLLRPDSLVYDEYGIADFDKGGSRGYDTSSYFSSPISQSFVISIDTGKIYKIEGIQIDSIINDQVVYCRPRDIDGRRIDGKDSYYKLLINAKGELEFYDIMPNKTVELYNPSQTTNLLTDKYGYTYTYNNSINEIDKEHKIIYSTEQMDKTTARYYGDNFMSGGEFYKKESINITNKYVDGVLQPIDESTLTLDGIIYKGHFMNSYNVEPSLGITLLEKSLYINIESCRAEWLDNNNICLFVNKKLYVKHINNLDEYLDTNTVLTIDDFECISPETELTKHMYETENSYIPIGKDYKIIPNVYDAISINGTKHYCLGKNSDGVYKLNLLTTQSFDANNYIFQPIN